MRHKSEVVTRYFLLTFIVKWLVLCISASFFVPAAQAVEDAWDYNIEIFASPGDERDITGFNVLLPVWQNSSSLSYADFRATRSSEDTTEISLGTGYRKLRGGYIIGANLFYDTRTTFVDNRFNQLTIGAEFLSEQWDLRFNIYTPASDKNLVDSSVAAEQFFGRRIFVSGVREEVLDGFDIELGYLINTFKWESRVFFTAYTFSGDSGEEANGGRFSFETRPQKNISLSLNYQNDSLFDSQTRAELRYSFAYSHQAGIRKIYERMLESVRRDVD